MSSITVLGAGSLGTAFALHLARNQHLVKLWDRNSKKLQQIETSRQNTYYLPDIRLPETVKIYYQLQSALDDADCIFLAIPSHAFVDVLEKIKPFLTSKQLIVWGSKGLVDGKFLHDVAQSILPSKQKLAALSGPSFAREIALDLPTAVTIASPDLSDAKAVMDIFHSKNFRPYANDDMQGVETGGVVKNVLAIAAGIADGLGYGANTQAALLTRGLAELTQLGIKLGGKPQTFYGLSGMGDLILTATDNQSRNRRFGLALGRGATAEEAKAQVGQVVEGARNAKELYQLAQKLHIDMPICHQVYSVLYEGLDPKVAVDQLLQRDVKVE